MVGDKLTDLIPAYDCKISNLIYIASDYHRKEIDKVNSWRNLTHSDIKITSELNTTLL